MRGRRPPRSSTPRRPNQPKALDWRKQIARLNANPPANSASPEIWPPNRQLLYAIDVANTPADGGLYVEVLCRDRKMDGGWSKPKARYLQREWQQQIPDADDRHILALLAGATPVHSQTYYGYSPTVGYGLLPYRYGLIDPQPRLILPVLCRTGRCHLCLAAQAENDHEEHGPPLTWQDGEPWQLRLEVHRSPKGEHYELAGALWRGARRTEVIT